MKRKDLLGLKDISGDDIMTILAEGKKMRQRIRDGEKGSELSGKTVATLFYENSTRTRVSFETAAKYLGASTVNISASASSIKKGESLIDTGKTLVSLMTNFIVLRHPQAGAPHLLANNINISVINGGDGYNEHPTQALLDMLTMWEKFGSFEGLKVVIAGDIKHSRVALSNLWGLNKLGAKVTLVAPATLLPVDVDKLGCTVTSNMDEAMDGANVVMGLRLQLERQQSGLFPSGNEYHEYFGINEKRMKRAKGAIFMHPGPLNRGLEVNSIVADSEESYVLEQVTNGLAVRMAVLKLLSGRA